jgi:hypothetical protein
VPRILLIDGTRLTQPGGSGDDWRVHLGYDLLAARLVDVRVADQHTAEAFELFVVGPGDVLVADRGDSRRKQWAYALRRGADVVVRLAVQQVPLLDEHGESLDVVVWLKAAPGATQSRLVVFEHEGHREAFRLIACALSAEAAERARAKARKKASKQQRELKAETLFLAGWLLVFSSLPTQSWSDERVLSLYRARWQVELVIKRMKQVLRLAQLRGKTTATNEATILALLVCWALQQQEAASARALLQQVASTLQGLTAPATETRGTGQFTDAAGAARGTGEQLAPHQPVCSDVARRRARLLDACTPVGLPALPAPLCVRQPTPAGPSGDDHPPPAQGTASADSG